jgi:hypothetical protein
MAKPDEHDQVDLIRKAKDKTYRDLVRTINALSPDYKGDIDSLEKKLATQIVMLTGFTADELKQRYCKSMGYDRWNHLEGLIKAEQEKWDKEMEQMSLEAQWNPDFYEWFKKRLSDSEPDDKG